VDDVDDLPRLERDGWHALSTAGGAAPFYERVLADRVLFLLPGGMVLDDRDEVVRSMAGEPWSTFDLTDLRVVPLGAEAAVVAYRAEATRAGQRYRAWVASTYVRTPDGWRLAVHQQTPA